MPYVCTINPPVKNIYRKNTKFNWTTQILPEAEVELQISFSQFGQSPDRFHGWHFSMQHPHAMQLRAQIISDATVQCGRQRRAQTRTLARTIVEAVCISIWLRETIMHCHQYITYKPFLSSFSFISHMLRDGLRTVAGVVVKSTWIIIPRIQSHNPASAFVITFISSQGHNSGKVSNGAIRVKVHEPFRICDKYRWGNETRRNRTDIKMVFVLADKLPGHSEFWNSVRPKPASFTSKWRSLRFRAVIWVTC